MQLHLPLLFNLLCDPLEKAQHNSKTYHDRTIDHAYRPVPMQVVASTFLVTLKEYPP